MRVLETKDCAINTATLGFQAPIAEVIDTIARHGFAGIAPWRREIEGQDVKAIAKHIRDAGLSVTGYCRSTYIPSDNVQGFKANIASNITALNDAAMLGAGSFVMVVGSNADLVSARGQVKEATSILLEHGKNVGVKISLEPLHPVYAAERSCLTLLSEALDMCGEIEGDVTMPQLGVCIDAYHVWWDPYLARDVARAGMQNRIFNFHICDWLVPTRDVLNDRGMMGDGVIDLKAFRQMIEKASYKGLVETEIFSSENWWRKPMDETLGVIAERIKTSV
jgi:sugar phosphate isomerase/epimerase